MLENKKLDRQRQIWREASKRYADDNRDFVRHACREWAKNNKLRKKRYDAMYYKANRDKYIERNKKWSVNNIEKVRAHARKTQKAHPETRAKSFLARYRAHKNAIPKWFKYERHMIAKVYRKRDEFNKKWNTKFEVDHIIPLNPKDKTVCGLHTWCNLQLLDKFVNGSKKDKYNKEWEFAL